MADLGDRYDELIVDFTTAIEDVIETWITGHNIPIAVVVGVLHAIAHARLTEAMEQDDNENGE